MKLQPWHAYAIALLALAAGSLAWWLAGDRPVDAFAGPVSETSPVPQAPVMVQDLARSAARAWSVQVEVDEPLRDRQVQPPARGVPVRKALQMLSEQLKLPLAAPVDDRAVEPRVHISEGGIIWGAPNPALTQALRRFVFAPPADKPDALHQVAAVPDPRVESVLHGELTTSKDGNVRGAAAFELGTAQSSDSQRALVSALGDEDEMVRDQARTAIQQLGGFKMEPLLRIAMQSEDDNEAMEAGDLLERSFGLEVAPEFWARFTEK